MTDLLEQNDPAFVKAQAGRLLWKAESIAAGSDPDRCHFLAPNDLQAIKACHLCCRGARDRGAPRAHAARKPFASASAG